MRYLLDTNICIYIARRSPPEVLSRLERLKPGDVGMSIITYLELVYGAYKSRRVQSNLEAIESLSRLVPVLSLDVTAARRYGQIRTDLEKRGAPIGAYDLLIAAHALAGGLTVVTNNTREFRRVAGLRVENWAQAAARES
jgi:tRNA(fMet)-specific endonuclease VapC